MRLLDRTWGWVALRGVVALLLGGLALYRPGMRLLSLILLFGAFACADGVLTLVAAFAGRRAGAHRPVLLFGGIAGLAVGAFMLAEPHHAAVVPLNFIAAWAALTGLAGIVAGLRLRRPTACEWLRVIAGALAVALAVLLVGVPGASPLAVMIWIGAYGVLAGILLVVLGFGLRAGPGLASEAPPPAA